MRCFILFIVFSALSAVANAGGLAVQSFEDNGKAPKNQTSVPTLGGEYQKQQSAAEAAAQRPAYKDQALAATQEYRGYNGRNLEQSFYRCKFESFRSAPPGDLGRGVLEKMRIRMYIMDTCMNSEGFFRQKQSFGLDFDYLTSADFIIPTPKN